MYVRPSGRGLRIGAALRVSPHREARALDVRRLVLETGDRQGAALGPVPAARLRAVSVLGRLCRPRRWPAASAHPGLARLAPPPPAAAPPAAPPPPRRRRPQGKRVRRGASTVAPTASTAPASANQTLSSISSVCSSTCSAARGPRRAGGVLGAEVLAAGHVGDALQRRLVDLAGAPARRRRRPPAPARGRTKPSVGEVAAELVDVAHRLRRLRGAEADGVDPHAARRPPARRRPAARRPVLAPSVSTTIVSGWKSPVPSASAGPCVPAPGARWSVAGRRAQVTPVGATSGLFSAMASIEARMARPIAVPRAIVELVDRVEQLVSVGRSWAARPAPAMPANATSPIGCRRSWSSMNRGRRPGRR